MGTDFKRVSAVEEFVVMGRSYGIKGKQVDGMDVLKVYEEVSETVGMVRKEHVPRFLEIKTYRYKGHSMSDPAKYRSKEELSFYKEKDPIRILKQYMVDRKLITEAGYGRIDASCKKKCDEAVKFAEASPEPDVSALYDDVFA